MSILRQMILDTIEEFPCKPVSILCRVLHIDNVDTLEQCCNNLVADGLLNTRADPVNPQVKLYTLTDTANQLTGNYDGKVSQHSHRLRTIVKFYNVLEDKNIQHYNLIVHIRNTFHLLHKQGVLFRCKYHIRDLVGATPMNVIQSAIYYLLHSGDLIQCGPLLCSRRHLMLTLSGRRSVSTT